MTVSHKTCLAKYGPAEKEAAMTLWDVPHHLEIGAIPKRLYCNRDIIPPLERAFANIIDRGLIQQLKTFDGCFNIRKKAQGTTPSLHSWGVAIDINAAWNGYGKKPTLTKELVACFTDAGFDWGGNWSMPDGMHFQLSRLSE